MPIGMKTTITLLLSIALVSEFPMKGASDNSPPGECPYPCLPPPTSVTNCPPPPAPPSPSEPSLPNPSPPPPYTPPGSGYFYPPPLPPPPPPSGYLPSNPPPGFNFPAPPPPNPILPYFPFYFKTPPSPNSAPLMKGCAGLFFAAVLHMILLGVILC